MQRAKDECPPARNESPLTAGVSLGEEDRTSPTHLHETPTANRTTEDQRPYLEASGQPVGSRHDGRKHSDHRSRVCDDYSAQLPRLALAIDPRLRSAERQYARTPVYRREIEGVHRPEFRADGKLRGNRNLQ